MQTLNLIKLFPTYSRLARDVRRQKKFVQAVLEPMIREAAINNDGSLDEEDFKKIRSYYGFGVPAIVGEGFCTLRGKPMLERERFTSTYQGALTGLYDDFFDKTHIDPEGIRKMMDDPSGFPASSSLEQLFTTLLTKVHEGLYDKDLFNRTFDQVFLAQAESSKQAGSELSIEEIKDISFRKGGYSLLFYRSIFSHELIEGEEEALYNAGSLMQLGNGIFDVYDDERQHIKTLLTVCRTMNDVRAIFRDQMEKSIRLIRKSAYMDKDKSGYLHKFVLAISRCFVCMDQLESLQQKTGGEFIPSEYSRNELVCDMEKPANMLRSIKYYVAYKF